MFGLGATELIVILIIILVLFGGSQLPKLARSLGSSAKELKEGLKNGEPAKKKNSDDTKRTVDDSKKG